MSGIQYTVRDIPEELDRSLREQARTRGKSMNALVVEALQQVYGERSTPGAHELDWFIGGVEEGEFEGFEEALEWLNSLPNPQE